MMEKYPGIVDNKNAVIKIDMDDSGSNPREDSNNGRMVCFHPSHTLGDDHNYPDIRSLVEDLAHNSLNAPEGQQFLEKVAADRYIYKAVKTMDEKGECFILVPTQALTDEDSESFSTRLEAQKRCSEKKQEMIETLYAQRTKNKDPLDEKSVQESIKARLTIAIENTIKDDSIVEKMDYVKRIDEVTKQIETEEVTAYNENAKQTITEEVNRIFNIEYEIVEYDNQFLVVHMTAYENAFTHMTFYTQEEAENYLDNEIEQWMDEYAIKELDERVLLAFARKEYVILPLYFLNHSGQSMNTEGFTCNWDSKVVGLIYAAKQELIDNTLYTEDELFSKNIYRIPSVREHVKVKGYEEKGFGQIQEIQHGLATIDFDYNKSLNSQKEENVITVSLYDILEVESNRAEELLKSEVKTYDYFLQHEVYRYDIEEDGKHIRGNGRFFGSDMKKSGMLDDIPEKYRKLLLNA